ncbi:expressed unknown protein [Seminavis robusta]|uniref:Uncharacterized protein n=1 Tax=Seminavis robusta TaxID=568900 RepID=A0A9N8EJJ9_9STRA|nr:expressed unknown protein [Seminavis robusta]|eukprot:Sro1351_g265180.1 n/a (925) ;mRNA; r:538-3508
MGSEELEGEKPALLRPTISFSRCRSLKSKVRSNNDKKATDATSKSTKTASKPESTFSSNRKPRRQSSSQSKSFSRKRNRKKQDLPEELLRKVEAKLSQDGSRPPIPSFNLSDSDDDDIPEAVVFSKKCKVTTGTTAAKENTATISESISLDAQKVATCQVAGNDVFTFHEGNDNENKKAPNHDLSMFARIKTPHDKYPTKADGEERAFSEEMNPSEVNVKPQPNTVKASQDKDSSALCTATYVQYQGNASGAQVMQTDAKVSKELPLTSHVPSISGGPGSDNKLPQKTMLPVESKGHPAKTQQQTFVEASKPTNTNQSGNAAAKQRVIQAQPPANRLQDAKNQQSQGQGQTPYEQVVPHPTNYYSHYQLYQQQQRRLPNAPSGHTRPDQNYQQWQYSHWNGPPYGSYYYPSVPHQAYPTASQKPPNPQQQPQVQSFKKQQQKDGISAAKPNHSAHGAHGQAIDLTAGNAIVTSGTVLKSTRTKKGTTSNQQQNVPSTTLPKREVTNMHYPTKTTPSIGHRCKLCKSCPCTGNLKENYVKAAEDNENQADKLRRDVKRRKRTAIREQTKSLKLDQFESGQYRFLPDGHELEHQLENFKSVPAEKEVVQSAKAKVFGDSCQPTLTQMFGFCNGKTGKETEEDAKTKKKEAEDVKGQEKSSGEDEVVVKVSEDSEEGDDEGDEESSVDMSIEDYFDDNNVCVPACRVEWRSGSIVVNDERENQTRKTNYGLWGAVVATMLEREKQDNYESGFLKLVSNQSNHVEDDQGLEHLLQLMENVNSPCPTPSKGTKGTPSPSRLLSQPNTPILTQRGKRLADDIQDKVSADTPRLANVVAVCPQWKENVAFAMQQRDPDDIQTALDKVQQSKSRLQRMKEGFLKAFEQHQSALDVFETSLNRSLGRLEHSETPPLVEVPLEAERGAARVVAD